MDLPYPTHPDPQIIKELSPKLARHQQKQQLRLSAQRLEIMQSLTNSNKNKLLTFIRSDRAYSMYSYLEKEAIKLDVELGSKGTFWNILHYCARFNAFECMEFALKWEYQARPDNYETLLEARTSEGYTALMLAAINNANETLEILLKYGGSDICATDSNRLNAYDYAFQSNNAQAIKLLMQNERKSTPQINTIELLKSHEFSYKNENCCLDIFRGLTGWAYNFEENKNEVVNAHSGTKRLSAALAIDNYFMDIVPLGAFEGIDSERDIEWIHAADTSKEKDASLFDTFNPLKIKETSITILNMLPALQSFCQHSWMVRKAIQPDKLQPGRYQVHLYMNQLHSTLSIDGRIPVFKDQKEPLFISNSHETWPMLVQKALAKAHGSYLNISGIPVKRIVEELTGFPTHEFNIDVDMLLWPLLEEFEKKGYYMLLRGKKGSSLSQTGNNSFVILNIFQKDNKKLLLVNCPFVDNCYQEQEEPLALKILRTHYAGEGQMCAWFDEEGINTHFSKLVVSCTVPNLDRTSISFKATNSVYFKFNITNEAESPIMIHLFNHTTDEIYDLTDPNTFIVCNEDKIEKVELLDNDPATICLAQIPHTLGQYQARIKLKSVTPHTTLSLIMWSEGGIQPEICGRGSEWEMLDMKGTRRGSFRKQKLLETRDSKWLKSFGGDDTKNINTKWQNSTNKMENCLAGESSQNTRWMSKSSQNVDKFNTESIKQPNILMTSSVVGTSMKESKWLKEVCPLDQIEELNLEKESKLSYTLSTDDE